MGTLFVGFLPIKNALQIVKNKLNLLDIVDLEIVSKENTIMQIGKMISHPQTRKRERYNGSLFYSLYLYKYDDNIMI